MCGIGLCIDHDRSPSRLRERLALFDRDLRHRGPDASAFLWGDGSSAHRTQDLPSTGDLGGATFALGFRQLFVVQRDQRAIQPLGRAGGSLWIAVNGQLYNYRALRSELESEGHSFESESDSEVMLAAYQAWGRECFARFNGMWAAVIVDLERRCVLLSRDRLGIKALYYSIEPWGLVAASEPGAVARGTSRGARPDESSVANFLRGFPPEDRDRTFYTGVRAMPAGTLLEYPLGGRPVEPVFEPFWELRIEPYQGSGAPSFSEAVEEFGRLVDDSVALRIRADVDVGCLLSGGIDTSTIAATAASLRGPTQKLRAFSIIYKEPDMSEIPHIWAMMAHAGLESRTHTLTPGEALDLVDPVVGAVGQPLLGQDKIAQYCAYRLAAEHGSTVTLSGQGPDEMLGGTTRYAAPYFEDLFARGRWIRLARELSATARRLGTPLPNVFYSHVLSPKTTAWSHRRRASRYSWVEPPQAWPRQPPRTLAERAHWLITKSNIPTVLQLQDRTSMAHSVESRVPFLDHRLVELSFRLPDEYKVWSFHRKRILRAVARKRLPASILNRVDNRTFISSSRWMDLRGFPTQVAELAKGDAFQAYAPVDAARVATFVTSFLAGEHNDQAAVWRLYTLSRWLETFA